MQPFLYPMTVSGPFGQYTVDALVDPSVTFSVVPAPALIEMGIEPVRVVRLTSADGAPRFAQLGRALTTVAGVADVTPVLFGEPGKPAVIGAATLTILLLDADDPAANGGRGRRDRSNSREHWQSWLTELPGLSTLVSRRR